MTNRPTLSLLAVGVVLLAANLIIQVSQRILSRPVRLCLFVAAAALLTACGPPGLTHHLYFPKELEDMPREELFNVVAINYGNPHDIFKVDNWKMSRHGKVVDDPPWLVNVLWRPLQPVTVWLLPGRHEISVAQFTRDPGYISRRISSDPARRSGRPWEIVPGSVATARGTIIGETGDHFTVWIERGRFSFSRKQRDLP